MGSLDGRVALVTGGGRGVGRAISIRLAAMGAAVAINYRKDGASAAETLATIEQAGGVARLYQASVDDRDQLSAMVDAANTELGPVTIVVNNAGIASRGRAVVDTDPAEYERVIRTHAIGPVWLCQLTIPAMRAAGRGDIVFISSVGSRTLAANGAPYGMGKHAAEAAAMTMAKEEASHGVRVNVLAPGLIATDMGDRLAKARDGVEKASDLDERSPFGRICRPEDLANTIAWLVSDEGSFVTGQRIEIDGGRTL